MKGSQPGCLFYLPEYMRFFASSPDAYKYSYPTITTRWTHFCLFLSLQYLSLSKQLSPTKERLHNYG